MKVREGGRVVNAVVLVATGVNGDEHDEVLGCQMSTSETGPARRAFFKDLITPNRYTTSKDLTGRR